MKLLQMRLDLIGILTEKSIKGNLMIKNIRHVGIVVKDLELSSFFYKNLLGFVEVKEAREQRGFIDKILALNDSNLITLKLKCFDGQLIELLYFDEYIFSKDKEINEVGLTHIAFTVEDIDLIYKKLTDNGIVFLSSPQISPDNYAKVVFCRAPEGTYIELVEVL